MFTNFAIPNWGPGAPAFFGLFESRAAGSQRVTPRHARMAQLMEMPKNERWLGAGGAEKRMERWKGHPAAMDMNDYMYAYFNAYLCVLMIKNDY